MVMKERMQTDMFQILQQLIKENRNEAENGNANHRKSQRDKKCAKQPAKCCFLLLLRYSCAHVAVKKQRCNEMINQTQVKTIVPNRHIRCTLCTGASTFSVACWRRQTAHKFQQTMLSTRTMLCERPEKTTDMTTPPSKSFLTLNKTVLGPIAREKSGFRKHGLWLPNSFSWYSATDRTPQKALQLSALFLIVTSSATTPSKYWKQLELTV